MRYDELIHSIQSQRREDGARRAITRAARAAPGGHPIREAIGRTLVRVGNRLIPEGGKPARVSSPTC